MMPVKQQTMDHGDATSPLAALVLGANGFIGSHLLEGVASCPRFTQVQVAGHGVSHLVHDTQLLPLEGDITADLLAACRKPDVVFWAIGGASVMASVTDPETDYRLSVPPLSALLDRLARDWHGARLLFLSSAAVYGLSGSGATNTGQALRPISPYGQHKQLSEGMIQAACAAQGVRANIIRPFSVYGPGLRKQLFWDALQKAAKGDYRFQGSGSERRDWVYVDDLIGLLIDIAICPDRFPSVLNAGTGHGRSVRETLSMLLGSLPGAPLPEFAGTVREGDPGMLVACAAEQQWFADYFPTDLVDGLQRYLRWHRDAAS